MGEYSHYCNVSNISISCGQECVLIPLKLANKSSHLKYVPATLPIHGTYTGYGSLGNITPDRNTLHIESHLGVGIEKFTEHLMRHGYDDNPVYENMTSWMLVDKQVFDDLSTNNYNDHKGDLWLGSLELLHFLGFELIKEDKSIGRYYQEWKYGTTSVFSDGRWLNLGNGYGIYDISTLFDLVNTHENKRWIAEKNLSQMWKWYINDNQAELDNIMLWVLGEERYFAEKERCKILDKIAISELSDDEFPESLKSFREHRNKQMEIFNASITRYYLDNIKVFGDAISGLCTLDLNMQVFSKSFEPQLMLHTPQFGAYGWHSIMLEKFKNINDSYIDEE